MIATAVAVGFTLGFLLLIAMFTLWWGHDIRLDRLEEQAAATSPSTEPIQIPTEPMPAVEVAGGLRTGPTPYKRDAKGRHAA